MAILSRYRTGRPILKDNSLPNVGSEDALIISKTKMYNGICVGGILIDSGIFVRLLDENGYHPEYEDEYEIKQVWTIHYKRPSKPIHLPHSEDIHVLSKEFKHNYNETINHFISQKNIPIHQGSIKNLFEAKIKFTSNGAGFISEKDVPNNSVCFWIPSNDLMITEDRNGKIRYLYCDQNTHRFMNRNQSFPSRYSIPFVGLQDPIEIIPRGTLIRLSLARWWCPEDVDMEERCYLQLSGWYDI
ncbi:hypothetical protein LJC72_02555 [Bacteroides sp. OttesenSCG-928-D19]|nr:hypothetical protein [Bacteroides sp. OttesenSCG-928-D19]